MARPQSTGTGRGGHEQHRRKYNTSAARGIQCRREVIWKTALKWSVCVPLRGVVMVILGGGGKGGWRVLRLHRLRLHAHGHDSQHSDLINSHDGRAGLVHAVQVERHGANLQGKRTIHKQDATRSKRCHEAGPAGGRMFIMWHLRLAGMSGMARQTGRRRADSACTWRNQHAARRARKVERVFRPYGPSFRG